MIEDLETWKRWTTTTLDGLEIEDFSGSPSTDGKQDSKYWSKPE